MIFCERQDCMNNGCSISDSRICMAADIEVGCNGECKTYEAE